MKKINTFYLYAIATTCFSLSLVETWDQSQRESWIWKNQEYNELSEQLTPYLYQAKLMPSINLKLNEGISSTRLHSAVDVAGNIYNSREYVQTQSTFSSQAQIPIFDRSAQANYLGAKAIATSNLNKQGLLKNQYTLDLVKRYFDVLKNHKSLIFSEKNVDMNRKLMLDTQQKYEVGFLARTDVAQAKASLDQALSLYEQAKTALMTSKLKLLEMVIIKPNDLKDINLTKPIKITPNLERKGKYKNVLRQENLLRGSDYQYESAKGALIPQLGAFINYQYLPSTIAAPQASNLFVGGISLSWTPFDGGATFTNIQQSRYGKQSQFAALKQATLEANTQFSMLTEQLKSSEYQIDALFQSVESAQIFLDAVIASFDAGQKTLTDVLDAQKNLLSQQQLLYQTSYDTFVLYLNYAQLLNQDDKSSLETIDKFLTVSWPWI